MDALTCWFCKDRIQLARAGCLTFWDREKGVPFGSRPEMRRVGHGDVAVSAGDWKAYERIVVVSHVDCGPRGDDGFGTYWVGLERLGEDWERHLRDKPWYFPAIDEALACCRRVVGVVRVPRSDNA